MSANAGKENAVRVSVRVPEGVLEALDQYVSFMQKNNRSKKVSRTRAVRELISKALDDPESTRRFALQSLVAMAVREAAQEARYASLADVRDRLTGVPKSFVERTLFELERAGEVALATKYNGNVVSERESSGAIEDDQRGRLLYVVKPEDSNSKNSEGRGLKARRSSQ